MNKRQKISLAVLVFVVAVVAAAVYIATRNSSSNDTNVSSASDLPAVNTNTETQTASNEGTYISYDAETFNKYSDSKRILFFHASWCPQCRELDKSISAADIPDGVVIFKVDYDSNQSLRQKHSVTIQTSLVLVDNLGNKSKSYVAYDSPTYDSVREALID